MYLGGESDSWVETILDAAEPTGQTLAMIDCVETLEEEHTEGMQEEAGHHHEEHGDHDNHDDHDDHDHLGTVTEIDEHVWTSPANAAAITRRFGGRSWRRWTARMGRSTGPMRKRMQRRSTRWIRNSTTF